MNQDMNNATIYDLSKAILKGIGSGLKNTANLIAHPLDSLVYPMSNFLFDATIIVAKGMTYDPAIDRLHRVANQGVFLEGAVGRMRDRIVKTNIAMDDFSKLPLQKQVEAVSEGATTMLVPGGIIKGLKHVANYQRYGTYAKPGKFHNTSPEDIKTIRNIKTYSASDIKKIGNGVFLYVYTEAKELLLAEAGYRDILSRSGRRVTDFFSEPASHPELAHIKPVYAAGEVEFKGGKIVSIDNKSGHYAPTKVPAKIIEEAFMEGGFVDAIGKYSEHVFDEPLHNIRTGGRIWPSIIPSTKKEEKKKKQITNLYDDEKGLPQSCDHDVGTDIVNEKEIPQCHDDNAYDDDPYFMRDDKEDNSANDEDDRYLYLRDPTTGSAPYFPCAAEFVLQDGDMEDMVQSFSTFKLNVNNKESVLRFSHHLAELSEVGCKVSQIALMCGGHKRTWNGIAKAFNGLSGISSGLTTMMLGKSILSMAGGFAGMIMGGMMILSSIMGGDDSDAMEQLSEQISQLSHQIEEMYKGIMSALETIHNTLVEGFRVIESHILCSVIPRLHEISIKIDRLESITCVSFKELHSQKLVGLVDALRKDLVGEITLSNAERKKCARKLGTWIDCDSKSPLQTSLFRLSSNEEQLLNVLTGPFEVHDIFPLFVYELSKMCNMNLNVSGIPNLPTFTVAVDVFVSYIIKYNDDNREILVRSRETFIRIDDMIREMVDSNCHNILVRQYHHYRFLAGRQIEKCRIEYTNEKRLAEHLKPGPEYEELLRLFTSMEVRRLMIHHLENLLSLPHTLLESKNDVLSTTNCRDIVDINNLRATMTNYNLAIRSLNIGCSINAYNSWGQAIHHATTYKSDARILHALLKCPEIQINNYTLTYLFGNAKYRPILAAMNFGFVHLGILLCAYGYDISEYNAHAAYMGNVGGMGYSEHFNKSDLGSNYGYGTLHRVEENIVISVTKTMNDPNSRINKTDLRRAYTFYKQAEVGLFPPIVNVSGACLLLLSCIIGDLYPFTYSGLQVDLNERLTPSGLTYFMLAVFCKNREVAQYLADHGSDINPRLTYTSVWMQYTCRRNRLVLIPNILPDEDNHTPLFRDFVSRIELTLNTAKKEAIDEQLSMIIEILKEDIDRILPNRRDRAVQCLISLEKNIEVENNLDVLDSIYILSNKRNNFGYCLSEKINRYILHSK